MTTTTMRESLVDSRSARLESRARMGVLTFTAIAIAVVSFVLLFVLDGWTYYRTPRTVRGYAAAHRLLRPSGPVGQALGTAGLLLMSVPMLYALRKKWRPLARAGSIKSWLQVHIFAGVMGPVLVTYHTSFKFNGIISVAYWLMVMVVVSGFVGRYLYVRIPKTLRGTELSLEEIGARAAELKVELLDRRPPAWVVERLDAFERRVAPSTARGAWVVHLLIGELRIRYAVSRLRADLVTHGEDPSSVAGLVAAAGERSLLLGRLALLDRTKRLFELWHVFHQPLVYFLFAIVLLHVAIVTYMGYSFLSGASVP